MPTLQTRIPAALHEQFLAECERRGETPAELTRSLVEAWTERSAETRVDWSGFSPQVQIAQAALARCRVPASVAGVKGFAPVTGQPLGHHSGPNPKPGKKRQSERA